MMKRDVVIENIDEATVHCFEEMDGGMQETKRSRVMKKVIYYFSGTGNSLEFAMKLAARLDADIAGIAGMRDGPVNEEAEIVGLVFPVYMYRPPRLAADFMRRLGGAKYLFATAVNGGDPGNALLFTERLLRQRGITMNAGFYVQLPDNYVPFGGPPSEAEQVEMFEKADARLDEIVRVVQASGSHREKLASWFKTRVYPGLWYALGYWAIPKSDSSFWVNDKCTGCRVCERVCPVENITLTDGRPSWHNRCEQCMACIQWCKETAIEIGKKSQGVERYTNPRITRKQIIGQKKAV